MTFRTRFAPSPTGPLHLGHAYSALLAFDMAMKKGGEFLLRIEDIDRARARPEWEAQIYDDLDWLGISWSKPIMRQSDRLAAYQEALEDFWQRDLIYPCTCNRRDILEAASAPQEGTPLIGPDGIVYPRTCLAKRERSNTSSKRPTDVALRLNVGQTTCDRNNFTPRETGAPPHENIAHFTETGSGPNGETGRIEFSLQSMEDTIGDVVLARKDMGTSYHLSVVLDDAAQSVTHVVRGQDLFEATKIHVVLQGLLGLPTPVYHHHRLIRDENGKRLAKRDDARAIAKYREDGLRPEDIRAMVGL